MPISRVTTRETRSITNTFGVNCIELKRNVTPRPTVGFIPNFANGQYIKVHSTFLQDHECDTKNQSVRFNPIRVGKRIYFIRVQHYRRSYSTRHVRFTSKSATGSATLEISFAVAVNENINKIIYYQMLGRIEFDKFYALVVLCVS